MEFKDFTDREKLLITSALYILECQCFGEELDHDTVRELDGTPDPEEVRKLMKNFEVQEIVGNFR
jgi:hypothetical protein